MIICVASVGVIFLHSFQSTEGLSNLLKSEKMALAYLLTVLHA